MNGPITTALITQHLPLIRSIAGRVSRLCRVAIEFDELISAGVLGLAEAARRFDHLSGNRFVTFAYYRIRGAMIDAVAAAAPIHRGMYRSRNRPSLVNETLACPGGQLPSGERQEIEDALDLLRAQRRLESALASLDDRQRRLLARVYIHGDNLDAIGEELGVSRSWACRLHARALAELREALA
jgi:RNA polymerase sigma factor for flagellar operon FliA